MEGSNTARPQAALAFREYESGDQPLFRRLNEEWIEHYFKMESKDQEALAHPEKILEQGGRIFFAIHDNEAIGCCALLKLAPGEFEVAKMAVTERLKGAGIGRQLLTRVIDEAKAMGCRRLYLETNHTLIPAIRLYESVGFKHLEPERIIPSRYARADVYMEMWV